MTCRRATRRTRQLATTGQRKAGRGVAVREREGIAVPRYRWSSSDRKAHSGKDLFRKRAEVLVRLPNRALVAANGPICRLQ